MRISRNIFIFCLINLIAGIVFINQLPQNVIFGFLANFYATEFINRWYNLIIPIAQVIATFIIFMVDVYKPNVPHKYRYVTSWVAISFTTYIMWVMMFLQYENLNLGDIKFYPLTVMIMFPIALFMLAEGFATIKRDISEFSLFGFKSVRSNADAWAKVHNMAGKVEILVAVVFFILSVLNEFIWNTNWVYLICIAIWFVLFYLCTTLYALSFKSKD